MKKMILALLVLITITTSCRVTKTVVMLHAKNRATQTDENYMSGKHNAVDFLGFSSEQKKQVDEVWKTEKHDFSEIKLENENIAPIVYKSENAFRAVLTSEQLKNYKALWDKGDGRLDAYFLDDSMLAEIKRIYIDK